MIQDMQLLDAQATIIEDLDSHEQRMIISSKCGSKSVTVVGKESLMAALWRAFPVSLQNVVPAALPGRLPGPVIASSLPAFFVDLSTEDTKITRQHTSSVLGGVVLGGLLG